AAARFGRARGRGGGIPVEMFLEQRRRHPRASRCDVGQPLVLLLRGAAEHEPEPAEDYRGEEGPGIRGPSHLLEHDGELDQAEPGAAVLLGEGKPEPAELAHLAPELIAIALA